MNRENVLSFIFVYVFRNGVINLGKAVPLVGGIIGGAMDLSSTNIIGNVARDTFIIE